ncbi:MAG: GFA family protein [Candidatus Binataceae bacterium]
MADDGPKVYCGGCHCGHVAYELDGPIDGRVSQCNCSICRKKAYLHWIIPRARFHLLTAWEDLATYTFNTHAAKHYFCPRCGVASFYIARSNPDQIDVNLRCVDGLEPASLKVEQFDGRNWEESIAAFRHGENNIKRR